MNRIDFVLARRNRVLVTRSLPALATSLVLGLALLSTPAGGQQDSVIGTPHNLSVSGPGEIRSTSETQVCKFCHIPHNAVVPSPLWGRRLSDAEYDTPEISTGPDGARAPAPQPDGNSRLCLSCHDGTIALGDVAGEAQPIPMVGADRLTRGRPGFLGTDLTGSHPISFVVTDRGADSTEGTQDMGLLPLAVIRSDAVVKLDGESKLQCTTCHDAHSDRFYEAGRTPRFWVAPTVEEVCLACHVPL